MCCVFSSETSGTQVLHLGLRNHFRGEAERLQEPEEQEAMRLFLLDISERLHP